MDRRNIARWALGVIAVLMAPAGLQAAFAPRRFFDDFPIGRGGSRSATRPTTSTSCATSAHCSSH